MLLLYLSLCLPSLVLSWPDGAPCVHAAFESMNPLEAVEHQGGLQLSSPPYEIVIDQKCYWRNQPIGVTLQGKNSTTKFKGFVLQPFEYSNGRTMRRVGQLMRLDDNGSWQQQCFTKKDSATHSHDEKKKHIKLWWKNDDDSRTVQFVATVVEHIKRFWVRSVVSIPIPPCRVQRDGSRGWSEPMPTMPPPVKPFKMETHRVFGTGGFQRAPFRNNSIDPFNSLEVGEAHVEIIETSTVMDAVTTQNPPLSTEPSRPQITSHHEPISQIIPVPNMETIHSHTFNENTQGRGEVRVIEGGSDGTQIVSNRISGDVTSSPTTRRFPFARPFSTRRRLQTTRRIQTTTSTPRRISTPVQHITQPQQQTVFSVDQVARVQPVQLTEQQQAVARQQLFPQQQQQILQQRPPQQFQLQPVQQQTQFQQQFTQQQLLQQQQQRNRFLFQQQQIRQQQFMGNAVICRDLDSRCFQWTQFCQFNSFVAL